MSLWIQRCGIAVAVSTALATAGCSAPPPPPGDHGDQPRQVDVQAQGSIEVAPDIATIHASLLERTPAQPADQQSSTDAKALGQARDGLERRMGEAIRAIEGAGVDTKDVSAGSLNVAPETFYERANSDDRQQMSRTRVERPLTVTVRDLEKVPAVLNALTEAGVDNLSGVDYALADPDKANDEALHKALERARAKAELMAKSLGAELGPVQSIEENTSGGGPRPPMMMARMASAKSESAPAPEYRKGQLNREFSVHVVWQLR
ncbi:26 kDa periplasmic immunogenic protein [Carnimonas sp. R-84981]|uniref:SIMPL domain-containing protein n=1 Tax=Carnimonas bestiolae TaxID=3402172 RepID=UPI003EDB7D84